MPRSLSAPDHHHKLGFDSKSLLALKGLNLKQQGGDNAKEITDGLKEVQKTMEATWAEMGSTYYQKPDGILSPKLQL